MASSLKSLGISCREYRRTERWIMQYTGCVLGADGRGGSGVFVDLPNNRTGLITAKHVVVPAAITGELTVSAAGRNMSTSVLPSAIRIDDRLDLAYLIMPDDFIAPAKIDSTNWREITEWKKEHEFVICCGVIGDWKSEPDLKTKTIRSTKVLHYWSSTEPSKCRLPIVTVDVDNSNPTLPRSLNGMSGGPVLDRELRLLGINIGENSRSHPTELYFLPISSIKEIFVPFQPPPLAPTDFIGQQLMMGIEVENRICKQRTRGNVFFDLFHSQSRPDDKFGRVCRITGLRFEPAMNLPINLEAVIELVDDNSEMLRREIRTELDIVLNGTGYTVL